MTGFERPALWVRCTPAFINAAPNACGPTPRRGRADGVGHDHLVDSDWLELSVYHSVLDEGGQELAANLADAFGIPVTEVAVWVRDHPRYALEPHKLPPATAMPSHWFGG